jgi:hypothetical protein
MGRYVLFSSRNDIAHRFIQLARSLNHQILCLHPYSKHGPNGINYNRVLTSIGGIPLRYSFRDEQIGVYGYHQIKSLVSILKQTDGVIWAAHPFMGETTWSLNPEDRVKDYMQDLNNLLSLMEIGKVRKFVCLCVYPEIESGAELHEDEWTGINMHEERKVAKNVVDLVSSKNRMQWSIVRASYATSAIRAEGDRQSAYKKGEFVNWVGEVAQSMLDVLEGGSEKEMVVNTARLPKKEKSQRLSAERVSLGEDVPKAIPMQQHTNG